jgi:NADPH:quinone reductase-like Zn-dependent oxidoreductase
MQRLQLTGHGEPSDVVELRETDEPVIRDNEVLVALEAAPLNPSDFMLVRGNYRFRPTLPCPVGSEGVGRILRSGPNVDDALRGKRVLIVPNNEQGTWADRIIVPIRNIVPLDSDADPVQLSMIGINALTAYLMLSKYVTLMPGDWIGQTAANSAVGEYIAKLAKLAGVKTLNVVRRRDAAEHVRQFGGDRVVVVGDRLQRDIEEALGGQKLSLVLDCLGGAPVGELAKWLKPGGSVACYGIVDGQFPIFSPYEFIFRSLSLHGFSVSNWLRNASRTVIQETYQKLAELVAERSLSVAVDAVYPLDQFKEAFAQSLKSKRSGKILFKFRSS